MTVLVVVVAGVIAVVLVIKVMWGRRRRVTNNDDVQEIEMGAVGGVPAPQPAVVAAPPIVDAGAGAGASGGAIPRRIPTTFRPTLNSRFGRKKVEVAQGKKNYIQLLSCF